MGNGCKLKKWKNKKKGELGNTTRVYFNKLNVALCFQQKYQRTQILLEVKILPDPQGNEMIKHLKLTFKFAGWLTKSMIMRKRKS